jgi:hypothetical protein
MPSLAALAEIIISDPHEALAPRCPKSSPFHLSIMRFRKTQLARAAAQLLLNDRYGQRETLRIQFLRPLPQHRIFANVLICPINRNTAPRFSTSQ